MKNIFFFILIIFVGFVSIIYPQQKYRKAVYLTQSVGTFIYNYPGASTNVPAEVVNYNTLNAYTGEDSCTIYNPTDDYPTGGNQLWRWQKAFYDSADYSFKEDYLDTDIYDIIMIKHCFASQSDIWFYWYEGPQDTINYPFTQSIYNFQWYTRKIARKMEEYPNKFFVWWNIPPMVPGQNSNVADMERLRWFNKWMVDTLAAGLDTLYGEFPQNIYIFDYFELVDSANFLPLSLAESWTDSHPNDTASELVVPILVEEMFNAAIAYENLTVPVELTSFTGSYENGVVNLKWLTATEKSNYGFEVEKRNDYSGYGSIGFVNGTGTSTNRITYNFIDENLSSARYYYRLKQIDLDGTIEYSNEVMIEIDDLNDFQLYQNYPNPFNPGTEINFTLAKAGNITLKIYNGLGSEVATLLDGFMTSGKHSVKFDAQNLTTGIYFYRIKGEDFTSTRKMLLIK